MVEEITITVDVPDEILADAQAEYEAGSGDLEDYVIDRFRFSWVKDNRTSTCTD